MLKSANGAVGTGSRFGGGRAMGTSHRRAHETELRGPSEELTH